jgi:hypothetical protein
MPETLFTTPVQVELTDDELKIVLRVWKDLPTESPARLMAVKGKIAEAAKSAVGGGEDMP